MKIYWAPTSDDSQHLAYDKFYTLNSELRKNKNDKEVDTFFACAGFKEIMQNHFVFNNPINAILEVLPNGNIYTGASDNKVLDPITRPSGIKNAHSINLRYGIIFYSPKSVNMTITPPYMHNTLLDKYGTLIPGKFDISKWFRPVNFEYQLWEGVSKFEVRSGEPSFYISFDTDEKIEFVRFDPTQKIYSYMNKCTRFKQIEPYKPLSYLYDKFMSAHMGKYIMAEINNSLNSK